MSDRKFKLLERHAVMLREHFSSVQIIAVTCDDDGVCQLLSTGRGSYYERQAAIRDYLVNQDERERVNARKMYRDDDDDESQESP